MNTRRKRWLLAGLACCTLLLLSVSVNPGRRYGLVDQSGKSLPNAFVFYHYSAGAKTIWPWAHHDGPFLTRTDQDGRFSIPWKAHLRFPIVTWTAPVRAYISAYVPQLHNSCELLDPVEVESYCAKPVGAHTFRILDLTIRPAQRFRTLWLLIYAQQAQSQGPAQDRRDLIGTARREYDEFLAEYGSTVFENSPSEWGHIPTSDWTKEPGERRSWSFFLQTVPFYGVTMNDKLTHMEKQVSRSR